MSIDSGVTHRIIGTDDEIVDEYRVHDAARRVYEDLSGFDLLYVSGGLGTVALMDNEARHRLSEDMGRRAAAGVGAARAPCSSAVPAICATSARRRTTGDGILAPALSRGGDESARGGRGRVVTAGGVSSSLDLGLYLVEKYWGVDARKTDRGPDGVPRLLSRLRRGRGAPSRLASLELRGPLLLEGGHALRVIGRLTHDGHVGGHEVQVRPEIETKALVDEPLDHPDRDLGSLGDLPANA